MKPREWSARERQVRLHTKGHRKTLVARFAPHMQRELEANAWKGDDWINERVAHLAYETLYHAAKLVRAAGEHPEALLEMCADVANCAAMVADAAYDLNEPPADVVAEDYAAVGSVTLHEWASHTAALLAKGLTPAPTFGLAVHGPETAPLLSDDWPDDIPF